MFFKLKPGDHVAIMPGKSSPAGDVLEITPVLRAGNVFVQLIDGRMYTAHGGKSLALRPVTYIVPAADYHHAALEAKRRKSA